jgi:hypothetical protein
MTITAEQIKSRLTGDGTLMGLVDGGVFTRPLRRAGPNRTLEAFESTTGNLLSTVVVLPRLAIRPGEADTIPGLFVQRVEIHVFGQDNDPARVNIDQIHARIRTLLDQIMSGGWAFDMDYGTKAHMQWTESSGIIQSEEFPGSILEISAFQLRGRHAEGL